MVGYESRKWWSILFQMHGSVLPALAGRVAAVGLFGAIALWLDNSTGLHLAPIAHSLVGVALGLLLVFRTNASYDRYWEGRKLLGAMVNRTRDFTRQVVGWVDVTATSDQAELGRLTKLLYATIRQALRKETDLEALGDRITADEKRLLAGVSSRPTVVAAWITQRTAQLCADGHIDPFRVPSMDANMTALLDALGGCERIVKTPIPFAYAQHIKSFLLLFCFTTPFAMVDSMGLLAPIAAMVVGFALFGIEEIGVEIEDPFGYDPNDLPLDAIGQTIDGDIDALLALRPGRPL